MPLKLSLRRIITVPIDYKARGFKLSNKEVLFLKGLHESLNISIDQHLTYCGKFYRANGISRSDNFHILKPAQELSTLYFDRVFELINVHDITKFHVTLMGTFLDSFSNFDEELNQNGFTNTWGFYQKRNIDLCEAKVNFRDDFFNIDNEMNLRKIFITEPFCNINLIQYTIPDENRTRAEKNLLYMKELYLDIHQRVNNLAKVLE
jgi:hypothetical protein